MDTLDKIIKKICITCDKEFYIPRSAIGKTVGSGLHCSNNCRRRRVIKKCDYCKTFFEVRFSEARLKYCSKNCYSQAKKVTREHYLERIKVNRRARIARLHKAEGDFSIDYFKWLCVQLNYICGMCNGTFAPNKLTIDHIIPITKGGKHNNDNVQPLCCSCNAKKGNRVIFLDQRVKDLYTQYI